MEYWVRVEESGNTYEFVAEQLERKSEGWSPNRGRYYKWMLQGSKTWCKGLEWIDAECDLRHAVAYIVNTVRFGLDLRHAVAYIVNTVRFELDWGTQLCILW
jgi:hypothetical protein